MIPPLVAADAPKGEKQLFARLRDDPNARDWLVLHSFDIRRHVARAEGEADMVVVVPGLGVLCIEVKVCGVVREGGSGPIPTTRPRRLRSAPFAKQARPLTRFVSTSRSRTLHSRPSCFTPQSCSRRWTSPTSRSSGNRGRSSGEPSFSGSRSRRSSPVCWRRRIPSVVRASRCQHGTGAKVVRRFDNWRPS
ncbi:MAG: NERD domain-containing protein [Rubrivivax sp.]|nr:NERD domain-containing protein [Rubrivivax sp.]